MEVKEFCEIVKNEYLFYLYKHQTVFPYCCHTSANLISSYLTVHFSDLYEHRICTKKVHGWTANEKLMIDFTGFQFFISETVKEKFRNQTKPIKKTEFYEIIDNYTNISPVFSDKNTIYYKNWNEHSDLTSTSRLYGIEFAKKVKNPFTLDGFMDYVHDALNEVDKSIVSDGLYRLD